MPVKTSVSVDTKRWDSIARRVPGLAKAKLRVGVIGAGAAEAHEGGGGATVGEVASWHEYGTEAVPQRPFVKRTFDLRRAELKRIMADVARSVMLRNIEPKAAMQAIGEWAVAAVRATILRGQVRPHLAPSTIERKGSAIPLLETGQLVENITYEFTL